LGQDLCQKADTFNPALVTLSFEIIEHKLRKNHHSTVLTKN